MSGSVVGVGQKRPRGDEGGKEPPKKSAKTECSGSSMQADGFETLVGRRINRKCVHGRAISLLAQILEKTAEFAAQTQPEGAMLELRISGHRLSLRPEGVKDVLTACGWRRRDATHLELHCASVAAESLHRAAARLHDMRGPRSGDPPTVAIRLVLRDARPRGVGALDNKGTDGGNVVPQTGKFPPGAQLCAPVDEKFSSEFRAALSRFSAQNPTPRAKGCARSCIRELLRMLRRIRAKPNALRPRTLQCAGVVFRKLFRGVAGAKALLLLSGFAERCNEGGTVTAYVMEKGESASCVMTAIECLSAALKDMGKTAAAGSLTAPVQRTRCPCGFWGTPDKDGLCSVCFQKRLRGQLGCVPSAHPKPTESKVPDKATTSDSWRRKFARARTKLSALYRFRFKDRVTSAAVGAGKKNTGKTQRCYACRRKVGYLGFECRCLRVFCEQHRIPDAHQCPFDYKRHHQNKLKKENRALRQKKLHKLDDAD